MSVSDITETFNIIMQEGIEGGFAPPTPKARYTITRAPTSGIFIISTETRPNGTPHLQPAKTQELKIAEHARDIVRLQSLLAEVPTQYPGAEDIYGRNTSIVQVTDYRKLAELNRSGSMAGYGIGSPTEEQKAKFDEAVAIIEKWGAVTRV